MVFLNEIEELHLLEQTKDELFRPLLNERSKNADLNMLRKPLSIFSISRNDLVEKSLNKSILDNILMKNAVINVLKSLNYKKINPLSFLIGRNEKGMPFINNIDFKNLPTIYVTSSHKEDIHIAAASINKIGIDIEKKISFSEALINKVFTRDEIHNSLKIIERLIKDRNEIDQDLAYTIMFSFKEAVSKALGLGLRLNFKEIKIIINKHQIQAKFLNFNDNYKINCYIEDEYTFILAEKIDIDLEM